MRLLSKKCSLPENDPEKSLRVPCRAPAGQSIPLMETEPTKGRTISA